MAKSSCSHSHTHTHTHISCSMLEYTTALPQGIRRRQVCECVSRCLHEIGYMGCKRKMRTASSEPGVAYNSCIPRHIHTEAWKKSGPHAVKECRSQSWPWWRKEKSRNNGPKEDKKRELRARKATERHCKEWGKKRKNTQGWEIESQLSSPIRNNAASLLRMTLCCV